MLKNNKDNLINIIKDFSKQNILVVGDIMLDKYLWCEINRISPEAPVPIALVKKESAVLGGAANVANNLVSLGAKVDLIGLIGNDINGELILKQLKEKNISFAGLIDSNRPTTVKKRVMCGTHQSIRIDYEETTNIKQEDEEKIFDYIKSKINSVRVIIFSDYAKGLISPTLAKSVIELAKQRGVMVLSDPTPSTFGKFKDSYLIKPNRKEAESIARENIADDYSNLDVVAEKITASLNSNLIITLGKDGMAVLNGKNIFLIPTVAKEVYDVSGAGDTAIAALALGLASGASIEEAAIISNYCAGVVVGKLGTSICSIDELLEKIND